MGWREPSGDPSSYVDLFGVFKMPGGEPEEATSLRCQAATPDLQTDRIGIDRYGGLTSTWGVENPYILGIHRAIRKNKHD